LKSAKSKDFFELTVLSLSHAPDMKTDFDQPTGSIIDCRLRFPLIASRKGVGRNGQYQWIDVYIMPAFIPEEVASHSQTISPCANLEIHSLGAFVELLFSHSLVLSVELETLSFAHTHVVHTCVHSE